MAGPPISARIQWSVRVDGLSEWPASGRCHFGSFASCWSRRSWLPSLTFLAFFATLCDGSAQLIGQYLPGSVPGYRDEPGVTVSSRLRPEYQAPGIRIGDVIIRPNLAEGIGYDSNASGQPVAGGSPLLGTQGSVSVNTDWARNSLGFFASASDRRYPEQSSQSTTNWTLFGGGKLDVGDDQITLGMSHLSLNQTPRDLGIPQLTEPEPFTVNDIRVAYKANFNRLSLQPSLDFRYLAVL